MLKKYWGLVFVLILLALVLIAGCVSYLNEKPKNYSLGFYEIEQEFPVMSQTIHVPPKKIIPPKPLPIISSVYISDSVCDFLDITFYKDTAFAVFSDAKQNYKAIVKKYNGKEWIHLGKTPITEDQAYWPNIEVLDSKPVVFYVDRKLNYSLSGKEYTDSWKDISVNDLPVARVGTLKTNVGENGLFLAYSDLNSGAVITALWSNKKWSVLPKLSRYNHQVVDIDIVSNKNNVYLAIIDASVAYDILVYKLVQNEWKEVGAFSVIDFFAGDLSLSEEDDKLYISYITYKDTESACKVNVKKLNKGRWENVGKPFSTPGKARFSELQVYKNNIFLAYANLINKEPVVLQLINNEWAVISEPCVAIGKTSQISHHVYNNFSYVGYIDEENNYRAVAMPLPLRELL